MSEYPDDWHARKVAVRTRDGFSCQMCGDQPPRAELHIDHETPISDGGSHELDNLRALCAACHADRHDKELCAACSLFGHRQMSEIKAYSSVGVAHLCHAHYRLVAERAPDNGATATPPFADVVGECVFCCDDVHGRYVLADARGGPSGYVCGECRILLSRDGRASRRQLAQRVKRDPERAPAPAAAAEPTQE